MPVSAIYEASAQQTRKANRSERVGHRYYFVLLARVVELIEGIESKRVRER